MNVYTKEVQRQCMPLCCPRCQECPLAGSLASRFSLARLSLILSTERGAAPLYTQNAAASEKTSAFRREKACERKEQANEESRAFGQPAWITTRCVPPCRPLSASRPRTASVCAQSAANADARGAERRGRERGQHVQEKRRLTKERRDEE